MTRQGQMFCFLIAPTLLDAKRFIRISKINSHVLSGKCINYNVTVVVIHSTWAFVSR